MMLLRTLAAAALVSLVSFTSAPAHAGEGQRALELLPRDMAMVATWNVARSRLSPVGTELIDILSDRHIISGTVQKLRKRMGLDWNRDVDTVVLGLGASFARSGRLIMLIEGRLDGRKLVSAAQKERGFRGLIHRGVDYYQIGRAEVAFIDGYWVTARRGAMPGVIDTFRGQNPSVRSNKAVMGLLRTVNIGKDFWCVFVLPKSMRDDIGSETGGWTLHTVTASVDLRKRVRARVRLGLSDRAAVIGLGTWLRAQGPNDETIRAMGLSAAMRKVSVSRRDDSLDLALTIPENDMVKLKKYLRKQAAARVGGSGS